MEVIYAYWYTIMYQLQTLAATKWQNTWHPENI